MNIVSVIPLKKGVLKEELTYFTAQEINPGNIVNISVRNKKILAKHTPISFFALR